MVELGADCLHVDVMDGHFVPNLTLGAPVLKSVSSALKGVFMDVHLMVTNPEAYVQPFAAAGAHRFTFHIEATKDAPALVTSIKKAGMLAGVALKPATPVTEIEHIVQDVDLVLIMTVEPGFGGQSFMSAPLGKGLLLLLLLLFECKDFILLFNLLVFLKFVNCGLVFLSLILRSMVGLV